jgi:hypothetical protein
MITDYWFENLDLKGLTSYLPKVLLHCFFRMHTFQENKT